MVVLAMGKMGAGELNYSSDIDLICLFDETRFDPADVQDARASFIKATRRMTAILSDVTEGGYVFRTDLRLRPDAVGHTGLHLDGGGRGVLRGTGPHLGTRGLHQGAALRRRHRGGRAVPRARCTPFVWRRHLDFAAIQDAHDMRLRIRDHKGLHGPIRCWKATTSSWARAGSAKSSSSPRRGS